MTGIGICERCEDGEHGAAEALQVPGEEKQNSTHQALTAADEPPAADHEALIRALQAEISRHNLTDFMQPDPPYAQIGCSTCRVPIRPATFPHFLKHLTEDVIPAVVRTALHPELR